MDPGFSVLGSVLNLGFPLLSLSNLQFWRLVVSGSWDWPSLPLWRSILLLLVSYSFLLCVFGLLVSQLNFPQISPMASFVPKAQPNQAAFSLLGSPSQDLFIFRTLLFSRIRLIFFIYSILFLVSRKILGYGEDYCYSTVFSRSIFNFFRSDYLLVYLPYGLCWMSLCLNLSLR